MRLPRSKRDELQEIVRNAEQMAAHGKVRTGLSLLLSGFLQARADQESGEPWAEELIGAFDQAMDRYAVKHQLRTRPGPAAPRVCQACS